MIQFEEWWNENCEPDWVGMNEAEEAWETAKKATRKEIGRYMSETYLSGHRYNMLVESLLKGEKQELVKK